MGRVARLKQQTRATARGRRMALDHDRAARDKRLVTPESTPALQSRRVWQVRSRVCQTGRSRRPATR